MTTTAPATAAVVTGHPPLTSTCPVTLCKWEHSVDVGVVETIKNLSVSVSVSWKTLVDFDTEVAK